MNEVFLVTNITTNLNTGTHTELCMTVFKDIKDANAYIDSIKDRARNGDTYDIVSYGACVPTEPVSDESYDVPRMFTRRRVVYKWTNSITSASMHTVFGIEQRQVF